MNDNADVMGSVIYQHGGWNLLSREPILSQTGPIFCNFHQEDFCCRYLEVQPALISGESGRALWLKLHKRGPIDLCWVTHLLPECYTAPRNFNISVLYLVWAMQVRVWMGFRKSPTLTSWGIEIQGPGNGLNCHGIFRISMQPAA